MRSDNSSSLNKPAIKNSLPKLFYIEQSLLRKHYLLQKDSNSDNYFFSPMSESSYFSLLSSKVLLHSEGAEFAAILFGYLRQRIISWTVLNFMIIFWWWDWHCFLVLPLAIVSDILKKKFTGSLFLWFKNISILRERNSAYCIFSNGVHFLIEFPAGPRGWVPFGLNSSSSGRFDLDLSFMP